MVFTPPGTLIVRSREYGDGIEYGSSSRDDLEIIPDHYVKRLWRKNAVPTTVAFALGGGNSAASLDTGLNMQVQYINKSPDSSDRSVAFSATSNNATLTVRYGESGATIFKVEWNAKNVERSSITMDNKTTTIKEAVRRVGLISSTLQSRAFTGPDGMEYKWKMLYAKDSRHPVATTARLTSRDGSIHDESHPIYIAERGLKLASWIVATIAVLDRVQTVDK
ncbi:hypothetical protein BT96DRAFT_943101 [Gymnopus androsaceus JB14]|uniref:DUF6593 domain-containing protein n=1 Tax=Gymnopus androsaceus JB14 TaxID=1447944 RepID=A0A6A4H9P2_9AGAR|nr:hypothetical protein BT96DRAFT_943101 [Gymnopus androsaceus JB14]